MNTTIWTGLTLTMLGIINIALATICGLYLALWGWEHRGQRQKRRPQ